MTDEHTRRAHTYEVIVGNVGTVHHGDDRAVARYIYCRYISLSKARGGRASGEDVTLMQDGEPFQEYIGTIHQQQAREEAFEMHRQDDPHCTCNDCLEWFENSQRDAGEDHA
jgi:hypothetical protein